MGLFFFFFFLSIFILIIYSCFLAGLSLFEKEYFSSERGHVSSVLTTDCAFEGFVFIIFFSHLFIFFFIYLFFIYLFIYSFIHLFIYYFFLFLTHFKKKKKQQSDSL